MAGLPRRITKVGACNLKGKSKLCLGLYLHGYCTPQAVVIVYKSCWSTHSKVNLTVKFYCHEYIWFSYAARDEYLNISL